MSARTVSKIRVAGNAMVIRIPSRVITMTSSSVVNPQQVPVARRRRSPKTRLGLAASAAENKGGAVASMVGSPAWNPAAHPGRARGLHGWKSFSVVCHLPSAERLGQTRPNRRNVRQAGYERGGTQSSARTTSNSDPGMLPGPPLPELVADQASCRLGNPLGSSFGRGVRLRSAWLRSPLRRHPRTCQPRIHR